MNANRYRLIFKVHGGHVDLRGDISTTGMKYFDVVARSIALSGKVSGGAPKMRFATGLNTLQTLADKYGDVMKRANGGGTGAPAYAINGSAVGAMHGAHVTLLSTESGVGVRHEGQLVSTTDIRITADGDLRIRGLDARNSAFLEGDDVSLGGVAATPDAASTKVNYHLGVDARGDMSLEGKHDMSKGVFKVGGTLTSEKGASVAAVARSYNLEGRVEVRASAFDLLGGTWSATHFLDVVAGDMDVAADAQLVTSHGDIKVANKLQNAGKLTVNDGGTYDIDVGELVTADKSQIQAAHLWLDAKRLDNAGSITGDFTMDVTLVGPSDSRNTGTLSSTFADVNLTGERTNLFNSGDIIAADGTMTIRLASLQNLQKIEGNTYVDMIIAQGMENRGAVLSGDKIDLKAAWLRNSSEKGSISAGSKATLEVAGDVENLDHAKILGATLVKITAGGKVLNADVAAIGGGREAEGTQPAIEGDLSITATGGLSNIGTGELYGTIVNLTTDGVVLNRDGAEIRGDWTTLTAGGALHNDSGKLRGDKQLDALVGGAITNIDGTLQGGRVILEGKGGLDNTAGNILGSHIAIAVQDDVVNVGKGKIVADDYVHLSGGSIDNEDSLVQGGDNVVVTAKGGLMNTQDGTLAAGKTLDIKTGFDILNDAGHMRGQHVMLDTPGNLTNTNGGTIKADEQLQAKVAGALENANAGTQMTGETVFLDVEKDVVNTDGAVMQASEYLQIKAQALANTDTAKILAGVTGGATQGHMEVTVEGKVVNKDGAHIVATGGAMIDALEDVLNENNAKIAGDKVWIANKPSETPNTKPTTVFNDATSTIEGVDLVSITQRTNLINQGRIGANDVNINTAERVDNPGRIVAGNGIWIDTLAIDNTATGTIEAKYLVDMKTIGFKNIGKIFSENYVNLLIKEGHDLTIDETAHGPIALERLEIWANDVTINRTLANPGSIKINAEEGYLLNNEGIVSGKSFTGKIGKDFDNRSLVWAAKNVDIEAQNLWNRGQEIEAGENMWIELEGTLLNTDTARIASGGHMALDAQEIKNEATFNSSSSFQGNERGLGYYWEDHNTYNVNFGYEVTDGCHDSGHCVVKIRETDNGLRTPVMSLSRVTAGEIAAGGTLRINEGAKKDQKASIRNQGDIRSGGTLSMDGTVINTAPTVELSIEDYLRRPVDISIYGDVRGQFGNLDRYGYQSDSLWSLLDALLATTHKSGSTYMIRWTFQHLGETVTRGRPAWAVANALKTVDAPMYLQVMSHVLGPDWRNIEYDVLRTRWSNFKRDINQKEGFTAVADQGPSILAGGSIFHEGGGLHNGTDSDYLQNQTITVTIDGEDVETVAGNFDVLRDLKDLTQVIDPSRALEQITRESNKKFRKAPASTNLPVIEWAKLPKVGSKVVVELAPTPVHPIYETRFEFIDQNTFYGTDYFFKSIGYVADRTVTVIGDNFFINELVTKQVGTQVAGFLAVQDKVSGTALVQKLMDNAGTEGKKLGLQVGIAPTDEQLAGLESDIVWFVEKDVDGVKALVPQVFLSKKTVEAIDERRHAGVTQIEAGELVVIDADETGVHNNDGTIRAGKSMSIESKGKVTNTTRAGLKNGGLRAGEDLLIDAKGDVVNIGADIIAGRHGQILTDGDFTDTVRTGYNEAGNLVVKNKGRLRGGGAEEGASRKVPSFEEKKEQPKGAELAVGISPMPAGGSNSNNQTLAIANPDALVSSVAGGVNVGGQPTLAIEAGVVAGGNNKMIQTGALANAGITHSVSAGLVPSSQPIEAGIVAGGNNKMIQTSAIANAGVSHSVSAVLVPQSSSQPIEGGIVAGGTNKMIQTGAIANAGATHFVSAGVVPQPSSQPIDAGIVAGGNNKMIQTGAIANAGVTASVSGGLVSQPSSQPMPAVEAMIEAPTSRQQVTALESAVAGGPSASQPYARPARGVEGSDFSDVPAPIVATETPVEPEPAPRESKGSFSIHAKGNIKLTASDIRAQDVSIKAGKDLIVKDVHEVASSFEQQVSKTTDFGFAGRITKSERAASEARSVGARIQGSNTDGMLIMHAEGDVRLQGGEYGADVGSIRGKNVITTTAKDYRHEKSTTEDSGFSMGGRAGIAGFGVGGQIGRDSWSGTAVDGKPSGDGNYPGQPGDDGFRGHQDGMARSDGRAVLGETAGGKIGGGTTKITVEHSTIKNKNAQLNFVTGVEIKGEDRVDIGGADIRAWKEVDGKIQKGNVYIEGGEVVATKFKDKDVLTSTMSETFAGFQGSASSSLVDFANNITENVRNGAEGMGVDPGMMIGSIAGDMSNLAMNDAVGASAGLSFEEKESKRVLDRSKQNVNTVVGNIAIVSKKGDINLGGVVLDGRGAGVLLDSAAKLRLGSGVDTEKSSEESKMSNKTMSIGGGVGPGGLNAPGASMGYNEESSRQQAEGSTNTNTLVMGDHVILRSKGDTTLAGANVIGGLVQTDIGGKLEIFSQQDTYDANGSREDWGVTAGSGGSVGGNRGSGTNYEKRRTTGQQSGIVSGHLDLNVKGDLHMKGSHIITQTGTSNVGGKLIAENIHDTIEKDGTYVGGGTSLSVNQMRQANRLRKGKPDADGFSALPEAGNLQVEKEERHFYDAEQLVTISGIEINAKGGTEGEINTDAENMVRVHNDQRIASSRISTTIAPKQMKDMAKGAMKKLRGQWGTATPQAPAFTNVAAIAPALDGPDTSPKRPIIGEPIGFDRNIDPTPNPVVTAKPDTAAPEEPIYAVAIPRSQRPKPEAEVAKRPAREAEPEAPVQPDNIVERKPSVDNTPVIVDIVDRSQPGHRFHTPKPVPEGTPVIKVGDMTFIAKEDGNGNLVPTGRYVETTATGELVEAGRVGLTREGTRPNVKQHGDATLVAQEPHRNKPLQRDTGSASVDTRAPKSEPSVPHGSPMSTLPKQAGGDGEALAMRPRPVNPDDVVMNKDGLPVIRKPGSQDPSQRGVVQGDDGQWYEVRRNGEIIGQRVDTQVQDNRGDTLDAEPFRSGHNTLPPPVKGHGSAAVDNQRRSVYVDDSSTESDSEDDGKKNIKGKRAPKKKAAFEVPLTHVAADVVARKLAAQNGNPLYKSVVRVGAEGDDVEIVEAQPLAQKGGIQAGREQAEFDRMTPLTERVPTQYERIDDVDSDSQADMSQHDGSSVSDSSGRDSKMSLYFDTVPDTDSPPSSGRGSLREAWDDASSERGRDSDASSHRGDVDSEAEARAFNSLEKVGRPTVFSNPSQQTAKRAFEQSETAKRLDAVWAEHDEVSKALAQAEKGTGIRRKKNDATIAELKARKDALEREATALMVKSADGDEHQSDADDHYTNRLIVLEGKSPKEIKAANNLLNAHKNAVLVDASGSEMVIKGSAKVGGESKVEVVGENKDGRVGGKSMSTVANQIEALQNHLQTEIPKVSVVSCNSGVDCNGREAMNSRLGTKLQKRGIDAEVVGYDDTLIVDGTGHKQSGTNDPDALGDTDETRPIPKPRTNVGAASAAAASAAPVAAPRPSKQNAAPVAAPRPSKQNAAPKVDLSTAPQAESKKAPPAKLPKPKMSTDAETSEAAVDAAPNNATPKLDASNAQQAAAKKAAPATSPKPKMQKDTATSEVAADAAQKPATAKKPPAVAKKPANGDNSPKTPEADAEKPIVHADNDDAPIYENLRLAPGAEYADASPKATTSEASDQPASPYAKWNFERNPNAPEPGAKTSAADRAHDSDNAYGEIDFSKTTFGKKPPAETEPFYENSVGGDPREGLYGTVDMSAKAQAAYAAAHKHITERIGRLSDEGLKLEEALKIELKKPFYKQNNVKLIKQQLFLNSSAMDVVTKQLAALSAEEAASRAANAPQNDKYHQRVIVATDYDNSLNAADSLFTNHPDNSVMVMQYGKSKPVILRGEPIGGETKVDYVGEFQDGKLAGKTSRQLVEGVEDVQRLVKGKVTKLSVTGCNSDGCGPNGMSYVDNVRHDLVKRGINAAAKGYKGPIKITDGKKVPTTEEDPLALGNEDGASGNAGDKAVGGAGKPMSRDEMRARLKPTPAELENERRAIRNEVETVVGLAHGRMDRFGNVHFDKAQPNAFDRFVGRMQGKTPQQIKDEKEQRQTDRLIAAKVKEHVSANQKERAADLVDIDIDEMQERRDLAAKTLESINGSPLANSPEGMKAKFKAEAAVRHFDSRLKELHMERRVRVLDQGATLQKTRFKNSEVFDARSKALRAMFENEAASASASKGARNDTFEGDDGVDNAGQPRTNEPIYANWSDAAMRRVGHEELPLDVRHAIANLPSLNGMDLVDAQGNARLPMLLRGDDRAPGLIFGKGMQAREPGKGSTAASVLHHVHGNNKTGMVSTTKSGEIAASIADDGAGGYVYVVLGKDGVDVNKWMAEEGRPNMYGYEQEVLVPGGIDSSNIVGAYRVNRGGQYAKESFIPNPNFRATPNAPTQSNADNARAPASSGSKASNDDNGDGDDNGGGDGNGRSRTSRTQERDPGASHPTSPPASADQGSEARNTSEHLAMGRRSKHGGPEGASHALTKDPVSAAREDIQRVLVKQEHHEPISEEIVQRLRERFPNMVVMQADPDNQLHPESGSIAPHVPTVMLVQGHRGLQMRLVGLHDADEIASQMQTLKLQHNIRIDELIVASCESNACDAEGISMKRDLQRALKQRGIQTKLSGYLGDFVVRKDGTSYERAPSAEVLSQHRRALVEQHRRVTDAIEEARLAGAPTGALDAERGSIEADIAKLRSGMHARAKEDMLTAREKDRTAWVRADGSLEGYSRSGATDVLRSGVEQRAQMLHRSDRTRAAVDAEIVKLRTSDELIRVSELMLQTPERLERALGRRPTLDDMRADPVLQQAMADRDALMSKVAALEAEREALPDAPPVAVVPLPPKRMLKSGLPAEGEATPKRHQIVLGALQGKSPRRVAVEKTERQRQRHVVASTPKLPEGKLQRVMILEDTQDPNNEVYVERHRKEHPDLVVAWADADNRLHPHSGTIRPGQPTIVMPKGHGHYVDKTVGAHGIEDMAAQIKSLRADHDLAITGVEMPVCHAAVCDPNGVSIANGLQRALSRQGIDAEVSGLIGEHVLRADGSVFERAPTQAIVESHRTSLVKRHKQLTLEIEKSQTAGSSSAYLLEAQRSKVEQEIQGLMKRMHAHAKQEMLTARTPGRTAFVDADGTLKGYALGNLSRLVMPNADGTFPRTSADVEDEIRILMRRVDPDEMKRVYDETVQRLAKNLGRAPTLEEVGADSVGQILVAKARAHYPRLEALQSERDALVKAESAHAPLATPKRVQAQATVTDDGSPIADPWRRLVLIEDTGPQSAQIGVGAARVQGRRPETTEIAYVAPDNHISFETPGNIRMGEPTKVYPSGHHDLEAHKVGDHTVDELADQMVELRRLGIDVQAITLHSCQASACSPHDERSTVGELTRKLQGKGLNIPVKGYPHALTIQPDGRVALRPEKDVVSPNTIETLTPQVEQAPGTSRPVVQRIVLFLQSPQSMHLDPEVFRKRRQDVVIAEVTSDGRVMLDGVIQPDAVTEVQVVGDVDLDAHTMGGKPASAIARHAHDFRKHFGLKVQELKLVGCESSKCAADGTSLGHHVVRELDVVYDMHPDVRGYDTPIHVDSEGHKRPGPREEGADGSDVLGKHYDQHLIVMQQDLADVGVMGAYLQNKHLLKTALWHWGEGGVFRRIAGVELEPGAVTKLTLLGHGNRWFRTLGGRDGFELGAQVSVIQAEHDLIIPKIYAFGCYADCEINGSSLVGDLRNALHGFGIDAEVKGPPGPIIATPDGRKVKLDAPVPGSMNKDKHDVIVIEDGDPFVGLMAGFRFQKHPLTSGLVLARAGNDLAAVTGVFKRGAEVDIDLFGHGERRDGKRLLGGRDAKALASQVASLRDRLDLKIKKVQLFSCKSADCDEDGRSMVDDMTEALGAQGIHARVKGHRSGIELTPDGHTIKSPTRRERSESTGGWDSYNYLPNAMVPAPASAPATVVAEPALEKYVRRVIAIGDDSPEAYTAAMALYEKYPKQSVVMERFRDGWIPTRTSSGAKVDGDVKVQLVGEGKNGKLGNRDAQDLARDVAHFHARYGGKIAKVGLVSCNSNDCDATGKSLVDKLSTELHALGIDTNVVGRKGAVRVNAKGHKHAVPQGTPGSLGSSGPDLASGALPESMLRSLTPHDRALLGNLHALDDSHFLGDDEAPLTQFLFRGDARDPGEIFLRGFEAWERGPDAPIDLAEHQLGDTKTNFVSLSKVPSVATGFANYMGLVSGRHVFVTRGQRGLDVNKRLPFSWQPDQYEVAVPDAVAPEMILGAYNVTHKGIVAGSFQPNPRFEARMDREGFAARQRSLLDRHATLSSALVELRGQWPWQREPGARAQLRRDRVNVEKELQALYRDQDAAARRDANRRDFLDTPLKE